MKFLISSRSSPNKRGAQTQTMKRNIRSSFSFAEFKKVVTDDDQTTVRFLYFFLSEIFHVDRNPHTCHE